MVSRLSSLGDVVCTLPVAAALKAGHPGCRVVWAVDPRFAGIVECCEAVDEVVRVKPRWRQPATWPRLEGEFDAALDLQGLAKSAIVVARAKAAVKLGYHWQREGAWAFSRPVHPEPSSFHVVDQYVDVGVAAGGVAHRADFALKPRAEDVRSVGQKLSDRAFDGEYVVINAGAGWASKRWPSEHFGTLIDRVQNLGMGVVLIGGSAEADRIAAEQAIARCSGRPPLNLIGETSVRELVALLARARAHVGGDTGSTHIAAALGIAAVGLYSITRPRRSCPYGQIERCLYDPDGLANIRPEAVFAILKEAIA